MVATDDVIGISDPDAGWSLVSVEKTPRAADINNKIVLDQILSLDSILNEDSVAHSVVGHVVLHAQIMNAVNSDSSVKGVMDRIVSDVR